MHEPKLASATMSTQKCAGKRTIIFAPSAAESIADMLSPPGAFPAVRGAGITTSSSVSDSSSRGAYSRLRGTHAMRHFKRLHDGCNDIELVGGH